MPPHASPHQIIELKAGGPDDADGLRTAAVLDAYFHAEHMRAFRRLLWRRLAMIAIVWFLVGITTEILSKNALFVGLGLLGGVAAWAAVVEWRAAERLNRLVARR
jgi:hypothetical protein